MPAFTSALTDMETEKFNQGLLSFLTASPTPFHAVKNMTDILLGQGFTRLEETEAWRHSPGRYFVTRNESSIVAFVIGTNPLPETGIRLTGAHTDSPCLKVKPIPDIRSQGYQQLGVEVYGGVLLAPWFDRDLSLAGRVTCRDSDGRLTNTLIDLKDPVAVIPSLAIHLDREVNKSRSINPETELPPVLMLQDDEFSAIKMISDAVGGATPLSMELSFYDTNPAALIGMKQEFIASARLDNLLSCYTGLMALIEADDSISSLLVCNDHEEVGSASAAGAEGTFLLDVLTRITEDDEARLRTFARSLLISTDNAHGVHPNFPTKHESNHGPVLNRGPAIKHNANQRYATNSETAAYFKQLCASSGVNCQEFVNRADMACGSTIGPITAKETGIRSLDVGVPTFGMHSIRELAGSEDAYALSKVLTAFFRDTGELGVARS